MFFFSPKIITPIFYRNLRFLFFWDFVNQCLIFLQNTSPVCFKTFPTLSKLTTLSTLSTVLIRLLSWWLSGLLTSLLSRLVVRLLSRLLSRLSPRLLYVLLSGLLSRLLSRWICQNWYIEFSMLLGGFVEIDKWICWCCYMDFSKLFHVFRVLYQAKPSWRLTQICWSFCLELKVLHGTKYSMPFTMFFLKIFPQKYGGYNTYISTSVQKEYDWYRD